MSSAFFLDTSLAGVAASATLLIVKKENVGKGMVSFTPDITQFVVLDTFFRRLVFMGIRWVHVVEWKSVKSIVTGVEGFSCAGRTFMCSMFSSGAA